MSHVFVGLTSTWKFEVHTAAGIFTGTREAAVPAERDHNLQVWLYWQAVSHSVLSDCVEGWDASCCLWALCTVACPSNSAPDVYLFRLLTPPLKKTPSGAIQRVVLLWQPEFFNMVIMMHGSCLSLWGCNIVRVAKFFKKGCQTSWKKITTNEKWGLAVLLARP